MSALSYRVKTLMSALSHRVKTLMSVFCVMLHEWALIFVLASTYTSERTRAASKHTHTHTAHTHKRVEKSRDTKK